MLVSLYWVIAAGLAVGFLINVDERPDLTKTALKSGSIALLALIAVIEGGWVLLIAALVGSACGAALLMRRDDRTLVLGMLALALAHIAYLVLFVNQEAALFRDVPRGLVQLAVLALGVGLYARYWPGLGALRLPIGLYTLLVVMTCVTAVGLPSALWSVSVGAGAFAASSALVGEYWFAGGARWRTARAVAEWVLCWSGQAAITAGLLYPQH